MASEARLYSISSQTKDALRKFRLGTSRDKEPKAVIYQIDKKTMEIAAVDGQVYSDMQELADELPGNTPRYVLLSYPLTLDGGRSSAPYVMINYLPPTASNEMRMLYAGAKELIRNQSEVGRVIDMDDAEELEEIEKILKERL